MAAAYPNGTVLYYKGQWTETRTKTGGDILAGVSARLVADGLTVNSAVDDLKFDTSIFGVTILPRIFNVQMTLQVANGVGYGALDDVISIIRHEVFQMTDLFPLSDSIPNVKFPNGTTQGTGQPDPTNSTAGNPPKTFSERVSDLFKNLGSNTTFIVALVGVGFVAAILLIAEHPIRER